MLRHCENSVQSLDLSGNPLLQERILFSRRNIFSISDTHPRDDENLKCLLGRCENLVHLRLTGMESDANTIKEDLTFCENDPTVPHLVKLLTALTSLDLIFNMMGPVVYGICELPSNTKSVHHLLTSTSVELESEHKALFICLKVLVI